MPDSTAAAAIHTFVIFSSSRSKWLGVRGGSCRNVALRWRHARLSTPSLSRYLRRANVVLSLSRSYLFVIRLCGKNLRIGTLFEPFQRQMAHVFKICNVFHRKFRALSMVFGTVLIERLINLKIILSW
jgi:hypothetical protein